MRETNGTIGYVDLPLAQGPGVHLARLKNRAGRYVLPTAAGATAAAAASTLDKDLAFDPLDRLAADAYPIVYPTWVKVNVTDPIKTPWIKAWLLHLLDTLRSSLSAHGRGRLPDAMAAKARARLGGM